MKLKVLFGIHADFEQPWRFHLAATPDVHAGRNADPTDSAFQHVSSVNDVDGAPVAAVLILIVKFGLLLLQQG